MARIAGLLGLHPAAEFIGGELGLANEMGANGGIGGGGDMIGHICDEIKKDIGSEGLHGERLGAAIGDAVAGGVFAQNSGSGRGIGRIWEGEGIAERLACAGAGEEPEERDAAACGDLFQGGGFGDAAPLIIGVGLLGGNAEEFSEFGLGLAAAQ